MLTTMKNYALTCLFCILVLKSSFGAIKNGYEREIMSARQSLRALYTLLSSSKTLTASQVQLLKIKIDQHVDFISNYQLTVQLLEQFRLISPGLYNEIDSIKDKNRTTRRSVREICSCKSSSRTIVCLYPDRTARRRRALFLV